MKCQILCYMLVLANNANDNHIIMCPSCFTDLQMEHCQLICDVVPSSELQLHHKWNTAQTLLYNTTAT